MKLHNSKIYKPYINQKNAERIAAGVGRAVHAYRSYTRTKQRKQNESRPAISQYHENRLIYRRRRMPYRKRKQYVRFKKRVLNINYGMTKKSVMYHKDAVDIASASDGQGVADFTMCTGFNTSYSSSYDIYRCCDLVSTAATPTPDKDAVVAFMLKEVVMNVIFYNAGNTPAYIDLYWFYNRQNCVDTPYGLFSEGLTIPTTTSGKLNPGTNELVPMTTGGWSSNVNVFTFGMTPFMSRPFCQHNKITKVTKHLVAPGQTIEFQMRRKRTNIFKEPSRLIQEAFSQLKGMSKGFIAIVYGVPNASVGSTGQFASAASIYARREVTYKVHPIDMGAHEYIATV